MKKLTPAQLLVLFFVASFSLSCGGGSATTASNSNSSSLNTEVAGATPFASDEGGFTVALPPGYASPRESKNEQTGWVSYLSAGPSGKACAVGYRPISDEIASSLDSPEKKQKALEIFRDDSIKGMEAGGMAIATEKEEKIIAEGHPGLLLQGSAAGKGNATYFRIANILANARAYRISFFSNDKDALDKAEIQAFFKSLRIKT